MRSFPVPEAVRAACRRGLALHAKERSGDGLVPATVGWARRLAEGGAITERKLRKMAAWHARHGVDRRPGWSAPGRETPGYVAFLLWGGAAGRSFAARLLRKLDRLEKGNPVLLLPVAPGLKLRALLDLWKALIQVRAHTRKDGTQVRAHQRNVQTRAERKELVDALARKMAEGEHTRHKTLASALGAARHASKVNGKQVAIYEHPAGGWVATHATEHHADHPERIVADKGKAHLVREGGKPQSLKHLKGPILEGAPEPVAPKVKPARPKREKPAAVAEEPKPEAKPEEPPKPELPPLDEKHQALLDDLLAAAVAGEQYDIRSRLAGERHGYPMHITEHMADSARRQINVPTDAYEALKGHLEQAGFKKLSIHESVEHGRWNRRQARAAWKPSTQAQIEKAEPGAYSFYLEKDDASDGSLAWNLHEMPQARTTIPVGDKSVMMRTLNVETPLRGWEEEGRAQVSELLEDHYRWNREIPKGKKKPDGTRYTDSFEDAKAYAEVRASKILSGGKPTQGELSAILEGGRGHGKAEALFVRAGKKTVIYTMPYRGEEVGRILSHASLREQIEVYRQNQQLRRGNNMAASDMSDHVLMDLEQHPALLKEYQAIRAAFHEPHTLSSDEYAKQAVAADAPIAKLGQAFYQHREAVRQAIAEGKEVPAEVRNEYFEFADGPKLPKGPSADELIAKVADGALIASESKRQEDAIDQEWTKLLRDLEEKYPDGIPPEGQARLSALDAPRKALREIRIQNQFRVYQEVKAAIQGGGTARYTVHWDLEISAPDQATFRRALDEYAKLAGARAGHRHVVVRYISANKDEDSGLQGRAFYQDREMLIAMRRAKDRSSWDEQTMVHEMAHGLEYEHPDNAKASGGFVFDHTEDRYVKLNELTKSNRFQDYEVARPARDGDSAIWSEYLGKAYGKTSSGPEALDDVRATEVVSMGLEQLHADPVKFIAEHPEHFRVVWGMLRAQE